MVHVSEFLYGDSAGTNLDKVTDVAVRIKKDIFSHPEMFDGLGLYDEVDPFELGYHCFGDDPVLVENPEAVVAVFQTFLQDTNGNDLPLDRDRIHPKLKTIALAMDMRRAVNPPPPED